MHLIMPLCSGIVGAENGTVDIFLRGSSNRAPIYTGFEAQGAQMPSAALTLDAYGGRVVYVDDLVDVIVKDISGTEIRRFVSGDKDAGVEVISNSFTGTNYDSGAVAAGEPNDLQTILNMLITSFGSTNFNVMYGGTPMSLMSALASLGPYYVNVKEPAYGAIGSGAVDDSTAIQAALTAAALLGAGNGATVFFPPGTYRCDTHLHIWGNVSLLGCGPMASIIMNNQAAGSLLRYDQVATSQAFQKIQDLSLRNSQANSGALIWVEEITRLFVLNVSAGDANTDGACVAATDAGAAGWAMVAVGSTFWSGDTLCSLVATSRGPCYFTACGFSPNVTPGAQTAALVVCNSGCVMLGCWFANPIATGGAFYDVAMNGAYSPNLIAGCNFEAPTAPATLTAMLIDGANNVSEVGNTFGATVVAYEFNAPATSGLTREGFGLHTRIHREEQITTDADTPALADQYGTTIVHRNAAGIQIITPTAPPGPGLFWSCIVTNDDAAAVVLITTVFFAAATVFDGGNITNGTAINPHNAITFLFRSADIRGSLKWVYISQEGEFPT